MSNRGDFIETLKLAEDGNGYIARAYEGFGTRKKAEIILMPGYKVSECNMLETDDTEIATDKIDLSLYLNRLRSKHSV